MSGWSLDAIKQLPMELLRLLKLPPQYDVSIQVLKVMEPKQKRLMEAEGVLLKAEDNLAEKQRCLDDVQARLVAV